MVKKCMNTIKSREDIDAARNSSDRTITVYNHDGCPHCQSFKPYVEEQCAGTKTDKVSILDCPIDVEACRDEAIRFGGSGIPFTVSLEKGKNVPDRVIIGNNKTALKKMIDGFKE
jgi:glutaredoxin